MWSSSFSRACCARRLGGDRAVGEAAQGGTTAADGAKRLGHDAVSGAMLAGLSAHAGGLSPLRSDASPTFATQAPETTTAGVRRPSSPHHGPRRGISSPS
jgi:hypothetical protein